MLLATESSAADFWTAMSARSCKVANHVGDERGRMAARDAEGVDEPRSGQDDRA